MSSDQKSRPPPPSRRVQRARTVFQILRDMEDNQNRLHDEAAACARPEAAQDLVDRLLPRVGDRTFDHTTTLC